MPDHIENVFLYAHYKSLTYGKCLWTTIEHCNFILPYSLSFSINYLISSRSVHIQPTKSLFIGTINHIHDHNSRYHISLKTTPILVIYATIHPIYNASISFQPRLKQQTHMLINLQKTFLPFPRLRHMRLAQSRTYILRLSLKIYTFSTYPRLATSAGARIPKQGEKTRRSLYTCNYVSTSKLSFQGREPRHIASYLRARAHPGIYAAAHKQRT